MAVRKADAEGKGDLKGGAGVLRLGSGTFEGKYSFATRFEDAPGTNPEELVAAAHAGCFSMALTAGLGRAGFTPTRVHTTATVSMRQVNNMPTITGIELDCEAEVPGIDDAAFQEQAKGAKENCVISRALKGVETITLNARLIG